MTPVRFGLRWKILLFTVLPPAVLGLGTLWMVNHRVANYLHTDIQESLKRSASVFENMLAARSDALEIAAQVIVRDPRFFSILTLSASPRDAQYQATVAGVARDFNRITHADVFEVLDREGRLLASVGGRSVKSEERRHLVRAALRGTAGSGVLVERNGHAQVTVMPVLVEGRVVGVLVLGAAIGERLARELRSMTRSQVTFVLGQKISGSTFEDAEDRMALVEALQRYEPPARAAEARPFEMRGGSEAYLTLVRRIPHSDPARRQLYVLQRSLGTETLFLREIQDALVWLGVAVVLVALVMGFTSARQIMQPVRRLVRGAEEMERGNYDFPLEVHRRDELGYLADRFQDMRQRQRAYVESLQEVGRVKSEFIDVASHELRTPISVIKGYVELFTQGSLGEVSPPQSQALEAIERSVNGLVQIAEDATRLAQIEGERLDLSITKQAGAELVEKATQAAIADAPYRDLTVTMDIQPDLGMVYVDGPRISQALAHLVRNAIRFTPDGGAIDVVAKRDQGHFVIEVRDTGIGIPSDKKKHLFSHSTMLRSSLHHHSSSTLEFNSAGLGLGLMIVRGIVEAHRGAVHAESKVGQGSTFAIRVPLDCRPRLDDAA